MSRDYVGDMAETVSLLWPAPPRGAPAGSRRRHAAPRRTWSSGWPRSAGPRRRARSPRCSTISTPAAASPCSSSPPARLRIGISARLAKVALAQAFGLDVDAVEEVWHGIGPPYAADLRLGGGARRRSRPPRMSRSSARSCSPTRSRRRASRSTIISPSGNGTGSASSSSMPAARPGSTAAPATTLPAASPTSPRPSHREGVLDGELLVKGEAQGGEDSGGGAASFNALQQRLGRKTVSAKMLGDYPAFVRLYDILFDGKEDLRGLPLTERRARLERFAAGLDPRTVRRLGLDRGGGFRGARGDPRRRPRRRDRGRDAEAPRQPLCRRPPRRPLVQMEARSARRRLRADVRGARQRQALLLLFGLHLRLLDARRASCCRSARPISASPTRS